MKVGTAPRAVLVWTFPFAAGLTQVGARFIVHSCAEGAAEPRPYQWPPCGGQVGLTTLGQPRLSEGAQPYLYRQLCRDAVPTLPKAG
jgi:hypothetical protein